MTVQPSFGPATECCNGVSYDSRCDECEKNKISPKYDPATQLCCDGKIQRKEFEER
jgi:hypothetical protein